jgi:hypothetical protein
MIRAAARKSTSASSPSRNRCKTTVGASSMAGRSGTGPASSSRRSFAPSGSHRTGRCSTFPDIRRRCPRSCSYPIRSGRSPGPRSTTSSTAARRSASLRMYCRGGAALRDSQLRRVGAAVRYGRSAPRAPARSATACRTGNRTASVAPGTQRALLVRERKAVQEVLRVVATARVTPSVRPHVVRRSHDGSSQLHSAQRGEGNKSSQLHTETSQHHRGRSRDALRGPC